LSSLRAEEPVCYDRGLGNYCSGGPLGADNDSLIPGKGLLCGLGGAVGIFIMIVSVGSAPKPAAYFAREGCGGKWILTGDDLRPDADVRAFDWERDSKY